MEDGDLNYGFMNCRIFNIVLTANRGDVFDFLIYMNQQLVFVGVVD